jgi:uncharacterized protein YcfL
MKILLLIPLLLAGCTTVPVAVKFPDAPSVLMEKCPPLKTIEKEEGISIIDITKNVTVNYTMYHECGIKVETWIEWYNDQKKIFENIKK